MQTNPEPPHDAGHPAVAPATGEPDDGTLSALVAEVRALAQEGRTLAEAELAYQTSRAKVGATGAGIATGLALAALVILVFALFALIFGVLLGLATLVGPWLATVIVVVVLVVLAAACGMAALSRWRRTVRLVTAKEPVE